MAACYHLFLFLIVIDCIMRETSKDKKRGLQRSLMEQLEDIEYADDIALISQHHIDMKEKLLKPDEEARKTGLKINVKKKWSHLNNRICQHCGVKTNSVTPSFYYVFNTSLSCNINIP